MTALLPGVLGLAAIAGRPGPRRQTPPLGQAELRPPGGPEHHCQRPLPRLPDWDRPSCRRLVRRVPWLQLLPGLPGCLAARCPR